jgi:hypothetical protein
MQEGKGGKRLSRGERHEEDRRRKKDEERIRVRRITKMINIKRKVKLSLYLIT